MTGRVGLDLAVRTQLAESLPLVGLDALHDVFGATGQGGPVAVVDTGIDLDHPDLVDAIVDEQCFCDDGLAGPFGCCPDGMDAQSGAAAGQDDHGHGTRAAGTLTSAGVHAEIRGAPDAVLLAREHPGLPLDDPVDVLTQSPVVVDPKNRLSYPRLDCLASQMLLVPSVPTIRLGPGRYLLLLLVRGIGSVVGIAGSTRMRRATRRPASHRTAGQLRDGRRRAGRRRRDPESAALID